MIEWNNLIQQAIATIIGAVVGAVFSWLGSYRLYLESERKRENELYNQQIIQYCKMLGDISHWIKIELRNQIVIAVSAFNLKDVLLFRSSLIVQHIQHIYKLNRININNKLIRDIQNCHEQGLFMNRLISERQELRKIIRTQSNLHLDDKISEVNIYNLKKFDENICLHTKPTLEDLLKTYNSITDEVKSLGLHIAEISTDFYQEVFDKELIEYEALEVFTIKDLNEFNRIIGFEFKLPQDKCPPTSLNASC